MEDSPKGSRASRHLILNALSYNIMYPHKPAKIGAIFLELGGVRASCPATVGHILFAVLVGRGSFK